MSEPTDDERPEDAPGPVPAAPHPPAPGSQAPDAERVEQAVPGHPSDEDAANAWRPPVQGWPAPSGSQAPPPTEPQPPPAPPAPGWPQPPAGQSPGAQQPPAWPPPPQPYRPGLPSQPPQGYRPYQPTQGYSPYQGYPPGQYSPPGQQYRPSGPYQPQQGYPPYQGYPGRQPPQGYPGQPPGTGYPGQQPPEGYRGQPYQGPTPYQGYRPYPAYLAPSYPGYYPAPASRWKSPAVISLVFILIVGAVLGLFMKGGHLGTSVFTPNTQAPQLGSFAGYIQFGDVNRISAKWTVPAIAASSNDGGASTWIGLQGPANDEFFQIGTTETRDGGQLYYDAFWSDPKEGFHAQYMMSVGAGDQITAGISEVNGIWRATIKDTTSGQTQAAPTGTGIFTNLQLAEWIQEDPSLPHNGHVVYPQIGPMTMWQLAANGTAPSYTGLQPQWMTLPGNQRVVPGPLVNDQFTTKQESTKA